MWGMGIFDLATPLTQRVDAAMSIVAPAPLRVVLWSLIASILSMAAYRYSSNQREISRLKASIASTRAAIRQAPPDDYEKAMATSKSLLALSLRHVARALGPTLVAGLPVLFVFSLLQQNYSYEQPQPGTTLPATLILEDGATETLAVAFPLSEPRILDEVTSGFAPHTPVPTIAKPGWTDWLFANPAGALKPHSALRQIDITFKPQRFFGFGPDWLAGWEALFLTLMVVFSLTIKRVFRIA